MDENPQYAQQREIDELGWRVMVLELALKEVLTVLCAQDDLLAKRFKRSIEDTLSFSDRMAAMEGDPIREEVWAEQRGFIDHLARLVLPARHRGSPPDPANGA